MIMCMAERRAPPTSVLERLLPSPTPGVKTPAAWPNFDLWKHKQGLTVNHQKLNKQMLSKLTSKTEKAIFYFNFSHSLPLWHQIMPLAKWFLYVHRTLYDHLLQFPFFMQSKTEQRFKNKYCWPAKLLWETILEAIFTNGTNTLAGKGLIFSHDLENGSTSTWLVWTGSWGYHHRVLKLSATFSILLSQGNASVTSLSTVS